MTIVPKNWIVEPLESKDRRRKSSILEFPTYDPPRFFPEPITNEPINPRGPVKFQNCTPLKAMQKYVGWLQDNDPEIQLKFMVRARPMNDDGNILRYPFYKEHAARILDIVTMDRMAVHIDPDLHR